MIYCHECRQNFSTLKVFLFGYYNLCTDCYRLKKYSHNNLYASPEQRVMLLDEEGRSYDEIREAMRALRA